MAKSLRAKTRVRARGIRRAAIFEPVSAARTIRLAKKLAGEPSESSKSSDNSEGLYSYFSSTISLGEDGEVELSDQFYSLLGLIDHDRLSFADTLG